MNDVFTLMGGKEWLKGQPLRLDGPATRDAVRFVALAGEANRICVRRVTTEWETVYEVGWYRVTGTKNAEAEEVRAGEADTAKRAAEMIEESLRERTKVPKGDAAPAAA